MTTMDKITTMKNQPEKIYLQASGNNFDDNHDVSWCADRINKTDLVYIQKSAVIKLLKEIKAHSFGYDPKKNVNKCIDNFLKEL